MKTLLIGKDWFPNVAGGLNRYFYGQVHALPSVGVDGVALVSALQTGQTAPLELRGMAAEHAGLKARWSGARRVTRQAMQDGIESINAHFALYAFPALIGSRLPVPLVVHFHGPYAMEIAAEANGLKGRLHALLARQMELAVYRRAIRVITLSEAFSEIAHRDYGVPLSALRVVPGGIDLAAYRAAPSRSEARQRLGWPQDRPILLSVRRLARRMGLETLIDAFALLRSTYPDALLLIGGKGKIKDEIEARVDQNGLKDQVRLIGFIPDADLPSAYAAADLMVVPTVTYEGFGLVTAEALASGTPVLGTPIGGTPEILNGLEPSLVFQAPTAEAIADRLDAALAGRLPLPDPAACRAYAERYGWEAVAPCLRTIFDEATVCGRR